MIVIADYIQTQPYTDQEATTHIRAHLICDTQSDLPAPTDIPLYTLEMGSKADIIADSTTFKMQSDGTWIQQLPPEAAATYSKAEIDAMVQDINDNLDDIQIDITEIRQDIASDRSVLVDLINSSAKNLLDVFSASSGQTATINGITWTVNNDGTVTANGTATANSFFYILPNNTNIALSQNATFISGCPSGGSDTTYEIQTVEVGGAIHHDYGSGYEQRAGYVYRYVTLAVRNGYTATDLTFHPMICTKADYDLSPEFVAYTPTLSKLYQLIRSYHN